VGDQPRGCACSFSKDLGPYIGPSAAANLRNEKNPAFAGLLRRYLASVAGAGFEPATFRL